MTNNLIAGIKNQAHDTIVLFILVHFIEAA